MSSHRYLKTISKSTEFTIYLSTLNNLETNNMKLLKTKALGAAEQSVGLGKTVKPIFSLSLIVYISC